MGKPIGKSRKKSSGTKDNGAGHKHAFPTEELILSRRNVDADDNVFIEMSQELKTEGSRLFQKRDYKGAVLTYEKAVKLLPRGHTDIALIRSYLATCYMQMEPPDYRRAVEQCNLALEVSSKHSKALLKRARCYEALDRLDFAVSDVDLVLAVEPNNATALDISERVRKEMVNRGINPHDRSNDPVPEPVVVKERNKQKKKKSHKAVDKVVVEDRADDVMVETDKTVVEENSKEVLKVETFKVKLVLGEDIRVAQIPHNCSILQLREVVRDRFPSTSAVLVKFKDKEGDLVTITTSEELRWAEESSDPQGSFRLYITQVNPEQDPFFTSLYGGLRKGSNANLGCNQDQNGVCESASIHSASEKGTLCIEEWILQFAQLFKNHVGFNSDAYLDLHELGMKLYSEAIEDMVTSENAQELFGMAETRFQELSALALFNWGNVHMSHARKTLVLPEDAPWDVILDLAKVAYEYAKKEYNKAAKCFQDAVKLKPDFFEGFLALAQQQFEQAKLSWCYAVGSKIDLEDWPSSEVIELFNNAEDNMEKGTQMWEEMEEQRLNDLSKPNKEELLLQAMGLSALFKEVSTDEAAEKASNMRSQIHLLWGTMLYERSIVEFRLNIPIWEECLEASVEKFKLAGASPTDLAVMIKNHCSNETAQEGLEFKIYEIVQAWNEMYDAQRWARGISSFRLEPLFRRCVPKLHHMLEHVSV